MISPFWLCQCDWMAKITLKLHVNETVYAFKTPHTSSITGCLHSQVSDSNPYPGEELNSLTFQCYLRELSFFYREGGPSVCDCGLPIFSGPPLCIRKKILVPPWTTPKNFGPPPQTDGPPLLVKNDNSLIVAPYMEVLHLKRSFHQ